MQIKFHSTIYNLISYCINTPLFIVTIEKDDNSFDDIIADTLNTDEITIYDNDVIKGVYTGYDSRVAVTIYDNDYICVELKNSDIQKQINDITSQVQSQQTQIDNQSNQINLHDDEINSQQDQINSQQEQLNNQQAQLDNKLDNSVLGDTETIGKAASRNYELDETFVAGGIYYKAVAKITKGNILVVGGNCEETNINETIQSTNNENE